MITGRINQVAHPPPTLPARQPARPRTEVGPTDHPRAGSCSNNVACRPAAEETLTGEPQGPPHRASPLADPHTITAARERNAPCLHCFHRIRRARPRPGALPSPTPVAAQRGGRTGRHTRSAICRRPPQERGREGRSPIFGSRGCRLLATRHRPHRESMLSSPTAGGGRTRHAPRPQSAALGRGTRKRDAPGAARAPQCAHEEPASPPPALVRKTVRVRRHTVRG